MYIYKYQYNMMWLPWLVAMNYILDFIKLSEVHRVTS